MYRLRLFAVCRRSWPYGVFQLVRQQLHSCKSPLPGRAGCGFAGGAVNPSLGALAKHPCFAKPPQTRPRRDPDGGSVRMGRPTAAGQVPALWLTKMCRAWPGRSQIAASHARPMGPLATDHVSGAPAGVGLRGLYQTWMFGKSPHGRVHGAPPQTHTGRGPAVTSEQPAPLKLTLTLEQNQTQQKTRHKAGFPEESLVKRVDYSSTASATAAGRSTSST